jgi:hypothetical protein
VAIYLQGTSSLNYPVKNYKIKSTVAFNPGNIFKTCLGNDVVQKMAWMADDTFTLKCDYMEHSHKNNTPTAMYYDNVLGGVAKALGKEDKYLSPPRLKNDSAKNIVYRDGI